MKCDKLKSLKNIEVAYNVTTGKEQAIAEYSDGTCHGFASDEEVYLKKDVDEAIAELKAKLRDHCVSCPVKEQEDDVVAEKDKEIAELKAKLESVQASMYADVVDANMEIRRLRRALYNLRACYADMMQKRYIECKCDGWVHRVDKWIEVERRCLHKAEEYK